jgi:hypothetical protein
MIIVPIGCRELFAVETGAFAFIPKALCLGGSPAALSLVAHQFTRDGGFMHTDFLRNGSLCKACFFES